MIEQSDVTAKNKPGIIKELFYGCQNTLKEILDFTGKRNHIKLFFNPDVKLLSAIIISDINKLNQVLGNLFKNAVKFTDSGYIEFGLFTDKPGLITLYVKDTGIGISAEQLKIIFDMFRQTNDSLTRKYGGIDIGLTISKKIADLLNGTLRVESEVGKGSVFYLDIPVNLQKKN